jgi:single-stranded DNA-binding protein
MTNQEPPVIDEDGVQFTTEADGSTSLFTVTPESGVAVATIAYPRADATQTSTLPVSGSSGGQTNWHTVVAFKQWATYVRDNLHKRDRVEIAGYPHEREVKGKDGSTKAVQEIYVGFLKKLNK